MNVHMAIAQELFELRTYILRKHSLVYRISQFLIFITCLLLSAFAFGRGGQENELKERAVIEYIQSLPASRIDPKLPSITYNQWIQDIVGVVKLNWEINDCGEGGDKPIDEPVPACVEVSTPKWHCPSVNISLMVSGDYKDIKPEGHAHFWYGFVSDFGIEPRHIDNLSNLEATVKEVDLSAARHRPAVIPAPGLQGMTHNDFVYYVAKFDVHRLDPSLRSERFDGWLSRINRWGLVYKVINPVYKNCGLNQILVYLEPTLKGGSEAQPPPVKFTFNVGTWEEGLSVDPELSIVFGEGAAATHTTLSKLEKTMTEWNVAHPYIFKGPQYVSVEMHKDFPGAMLLQRKLIDNGFSQPVKLFDSEALPAKLTVQIGHKVDVRSAQMAIKTLLEYGPKDIGIVVLPKDSIPYYWQKILIGRNPAGNNHVYSALNIQKLLSPDLTQENFSKFAQMIEPEATAAECSKILTACRNRLGSCVSMTVDSTTCNRVCQAKVIEKLYMAGVSTFTHTSAAVSRNCVGYRKDIVGSEEGAKCIANLLGYRYDPVGCNIDGFPYSVWAH